MKGYGGGPGWRHSPCKAWSKEEHDMFKAQKERCAAGALKGRKEGVGLERPRGQDQGF